MLLLQIGLYNTKILVILCLVLSLLMAGYREQASLTLHEYIRFAV